MKVTSLKKNAKLFNYTKNIFEVMEKKNSDGIWKCKLDGYTNRWFPLPFLMKVDTRGMVPLATDKHKNKVSFNTQYDQEAQIAAWHESN